MDAETIPTFEYIIKLKWPGLAYVPFNPRPFTVFLLMSLRSLYKVLDTFDPLYGALLILVY
jgi:hypothetical protein